MSDIALNAPVGEHTPVQPAARPNLDKGFNPLTMILFFGILAAGMLFVAYSIYSDVDATGTKVTTFLPYILLLVSLLPVELILQVGSSAGFAMVFALLIAAIIWNLGTWYLGLPASSSHTLIGSIIGVGIANAMARGPDGTSGVDWTKATEIGYALLLSPLIGFF